jgi:hypothetical protein
VLMTGKAQGAMRGMNNEGVVRVVCLLTDLLRTKKIHEETGHI